MAFPLTSRFLSRSTPHIRYTRFSQVQCLHTSRIRWSNNSTTPPPPSSSSRPNPSYDSRRQFYKARNRNLFMYTSAIFLTTLGAAYAAVPLYRAFCAATGFAGVPTTDSSRFGAERLVPVQSSKRIKVHFNADTSQALSWKFTPQQKFVSVLPGETALAFYTAKNYGDKDVIGIATYNVTPDKIAPYFAKVECFCFEEQKLIAGEEVDLPLFFFIDKDFADDPLMRDIDDVVLSYTFFKARRNEQGHLEPDADDATVDAASGFSDYKRASKETIQASRESTAASAATDHTDSS